MPPQRPRRAIAIHYMTGKARFVAAGGPSHGRVRGPGGRGAHVRRRRAFPPGLQKRRAHRTAAAAQKCRGALNSPRGKEHGKSKNRGHRHRRNGSQPRGVPVRGGDRRSRARGGMRRQGSAAAVGAARPGPEGPGLRQRRRPLCRQGRRRRPHRDAPLFPPPAGHPGPRVWPST